MVNISHTKAPVSEVIFGITFNTRIWNETEIIKLLSLFIDDFPNIQHLAPLTNVFLDERKSLIHESNPFETGTLLYRLRNNEGSRLIQIQGNKIYFNWIRPDIQKPDGHYPGYEAVFKEFSSFIDLALNGVSPELKNKISYYELTYQDRVFYLDYIASLSEINKLLNINVDMIDSSNEVVQFNFGQTEILNEEKDIGILNISKAISLDVKKDIISIEYSVLGNSIDMVDWFEKSRQRQNEVFRKLINKTILESWI